ncbi:MAG: hypothetical protein JO354_06225 [Verrucomicrobia bacterium]|nr:hypothetical protein [Verrucomicrobiota bacterium]
MAANPIPTNAAQVIGLANKMHAGLLQYATPLNIKQITAAELQAEIDAFVAADGEFNAARSNTLAASQSFRGAMRDLGSWLQETRNVLAARFGSRWSTMWAQAGFIDSSTQVPARTQEQLGLALSLVGFFTANPGFEVESMGVTAAQATALRDSAMNAQQALATAAVTQKQKGDADTAASDALISGMRTVIKVVGELLGADDPRWLAFGLNMPAADTTPSQAVNVSASLDPSGAIVVQCDAVALATRYRWRMQRVGIDVDYMLAARSLEPLAFIKGVLPGQTANIIVQAVNGQAQGVASDPIQFTMLLPVKAELAAVKTAEAPVPQVTGAFETNGSNGNRNGHADLVPSRP